MKGKMTRKFKRYLTEPDEFKGENRKKYSNLTLKELKLQVGNMEMDGPPAGSLPPGKSDQQCLPVHPLPLQNRLHNKRNVLKRLPELINTPHFNNGNEQPRSIPTPTLFRTPNPLFVVNTLFEMLKEDGQNEPPRPKLELPVDRRRSERNEFEEITAKSVKIPRPPRLLDHEFTRLTHQTAFSRRKIYSEEKSRPREREREKDRREDKREEVELLTFYHPKQQRKERQEDANQFL